MNIHYKSRGKHAVPGTPFLSVHVNVRDSDDDRDWVNTDYYVWLPDGLKHKKNHAIRTSTLHFNYTLLTEDSKQMIIKDIFYRR